MKKHRGFVASYLLTAIALIVIVTSGVTFMQQDLSRNQVIFDSSKLIQSQISTIHTVLTNCALLYPMGDNGSGFHKSYPATGALASRDCPGSTFSNQNLWTGRDGMVLPAMKFGYSNWKYVNDATGVFVTTTWANEAALEKSAANLVNKYASGQLEYMFILEPLPRIPARSGILKYWIIKE